MASFGVWFLVGNRGEWVIGTTIGDYMTIRDPFHHSLLRTRQFGVGKFRPDF